MFILSNLYICVYLCLRRMERGTSCLGVGVKGLREPPDVGTAILILALWQSSRHSTSESSLWLLELLSPLLFKIVIY